MTKRVSVLLAAGLAITLSACGGETASETEEASTSSMATSTDPATANEATPAGVERFSNVEWRLVSIADGEPIPDDIVTTIRFEGEGQYGGQGPCNRYFGTLNSEDGGPLFGTAGATRMMCPDPQMALETRYFEALAAVKNISLRAPAGEEVGPLRLRYETEEASGELVFEGTELTSEE